jgi:4-hydroxy-2-oxoglutarate aldolase
VVISTAAVAELACHPNIVGMKDTSKEDITGYIKAAQADPNFHVLAGSITKFLYGLQNGAIGGVLSIANYFPELCGELHSLFVAGKMAEAEELNRKLLALNDNTAAKSGVAGVKAAMNLLGYKGGEPRVPLLPLTDAELDALRKVLVAEGFIK